MTDTYGFEWVDEPVAFDTAAERLRRSVIRNKLQPRTIPIADAGAALVSSAADAFNTTRSNANKLQNPAELLFGPAASIVTGVNRLYGTQGQERVQTFPERMARSAISSVQDAAKGEFGAIRVPESGMVSDEDIAKSKHKDFQGVTDLSNVVIGGSMPMAAARSRVGGATLGSGPVPKEVYHGFTKGETDTLRPYSYHSFTEDLANSYADSTGGKVAKFELGLQKPLILDTPEKVQKAWEQSGALKTPGPFYPNQQMVLNKWAEKQGHDGIVVSPGAFEGELGHKWAAGTFGEPQIVAFNEVKLPRDSRPKDIVLKSGFGDEGNVPVTPALSQEKRAPVFYSGVEHALESTNLGSATPDQWLGTLKNTKGVKPEEMQWLGIEDFLAEKKAAGQKVTRAELQDYVAQNKIEVKEVKKQGQSLDEDSIGEYADIINQQWTGNPERAARAQIQHVPGGTQQGLGGDYLVLDGYMNVVGPAPNKQMAQKILDEFKTAVKNQDHDVLFDWSMESAEHNMRSRGDFTKYSEYQLPGGRDYGELLLTLPHHERNYQLSGLNDAGNVVVKDKRTGNIVHEGTPESAQEYLREVNQTDKSNYQSSHWNEPNVLAHVRYNTRDIPKSPEELKRIEDAFASVTKRWNDRARELSKAGKGTRADLDADPLLQQIGAESRQLHEDQAKNAHKTLFVEEIQSDWHQEGRKKGYGVKEKKGNVKQDGGMWKIEWEDGTFSGGYGSRTAAETAMQYRDKTGVPDAPFKKSWPELAFKRMLRYAAENGYDAIAWTPGEVQAARYDLSKQVKALHFLPYENKTWEVGVELPNGSELGRLSGRQTIEEIEKNFGKNIAEKVQKGEFSGTTNNVPFLSGFDLKVGGEGMLRFYDDQLPVIASKYGKAHGTKVEQKGLRSGLEINEVKQTFHPDDIRNKDGKKHVFYQVDDPNNPDFPAQAFGTRKEAEEFAKSQSPSVHFMRLPESLRSHVLQRGYPLFSHGLMLTPVDGNPFEQNRDGGK